MKNRLITLIPIVLLALVPVVGCGQASPTAPRITPTLSGDEFVLSGLISDGSGDDGTPLPGVELVVSAAAAAQDMGPLSHTVTTDDDGHFSVALARGSWNVALSKEGYIDRETVIEVNGTTEMNFSMSRLEAARAKAAKAIRR